MKPLIFASLSLILTIFTGCEKMEAEGDVTFAQRTFEALAKGDSDVADSIDWDTLDSLGIPVGQQYVAFENEKDRTSFRKGFITQFSASFRESGGSVESFSDWRVTSHDKTHTEVAADSIDGTLRLTVSERDGKERLSAIEIDR